MKPLSIELDRSAKTSLAEQIYKSVRTAIENGVLVPGARLPSWLALAAQLGVARGTVRTAYEKLTAAQLIVASRASGTRVAARPVRIPRPDQSPVGDSALALFQNFVAGPAVFQMGVPGQSTLPAKLFARIRAQAVRAEASAPALYPDARGELELRREIAAYVAVARGVECSPSQIIITAGFSGGLGLALRALGLARRTAWIEEPCFPLTRRGLELAGLSLAYIPVDADGIDVDYGLRQAPDAGLVIITPGQQAPLGATLSLERRLRLLDWAARSGAWVIEDDYLSELQLAGRASPALASLDRAGRVVHIGSFSKTISPALRLGFLIVPSALAARFAEVAACLAPAPGPSVQLAVAEFIREGHYMRHLRRTKRAYTAQRDALLKCLQPRAEDITVAGLAVLLRLLDGTRDISIAKEMFAAGLAPAPLSPWYAVPNTARSGLMLGVATAPPKQLDRSCNLLFEILDRFR